MAKKKPLVMTDGKIEQLQPGDNIFEVNLPTYTNGEASSVTICQAVYSFGAGSVKKARSDAAGTSRAIALVASTTVAAAASGQCQTEGTLVATTAEWDSVTGQTGGLTTGATYFLSNATAGNLTSTAPTTGYVQEIGTATSTTDLAIKFTSPIKL